jgi:tetratricopeptide (TPR) repeat protein
LHERPVAARGVRISLRRVAFCVLLVAAPARAQSSGDDHLLAGAQHFRGERYREALVEFRVAERTGSGAGASWYVASALVKLQRPEEAITAFARAEAGALADRDALLEYYHALACYDAKLYGCADRLLASIGVQAGPRISAQARKIREDLAPVISATPSTTTIDWYRSHGADAESAGHLALAIAYCDEALRLSTLRPDGYRRMDTVAALRHLRLPKKALGTPLEKGP